MIQQSDNISQSERVYQKTTLLYVKLSFVRQFIYQIWMAGMTDQTQRISQSNSIRELMKLYSLGMVAICGLKGIPYAC